VNTYGRSHPSFVHWWHPSWGSQESLVHSLPSSQVILTTFFSIIGIRGTFTMIAATESRNDTTDYRITFFRGTCLICRVYRSTDTTRRSTRIQSTSIFITALNSKLTISFSITSIKSTSNMIITRFCNIRALSVCFITTIYRITGLCWLRRAAVVISTFIIVITRDCCVLTPTWGVAGIMVITDPVCQTPVAQSQPSAVQASL
jgi:hypothetical protein